MHFNSIINTCSIDNLNNPAAIVNLIQDYGVTALALAANKGHKQVVDVLLKAGANPDIQNHVC